MLRSYSDYLSYPTVKNLQSFVELAADYDFTDYAFMQEEMLRLYRRSIPNDDNSVAYSNGSTGTNNKYYFGPNRYCCIYFIEHILRGGQDQTFLLSTFPWMKIGKSFWESSSGLKKISCDIRDSRNIGFLLDYLHKTKVILITHPNTMLYLSGSDEFVNGTGSDMVLTSTDWEPFYDRRKFKCKVNDQMIDWKSGINFYTCRSGQYHFLPIFVQNKDKCFNLLNFNNKNGSTTDDFFELGNRVLCNCGKTRMEFKFIPHWKKCPVINGKIFYDLSIVQKLEQQLYNIQFLQKEPEKITVVYSARNGEKIKIPDIGCEVELLNDHIFWVGNRQKYCSFWRGDYSMSNTRLRLY